MPDLNRLSRKLLADLVTQRIELLEEMAMSTAKLDFELAREYARMARRLRLRHRVKAGRLKLCKKCEAPLIAGLSARVRHRAGHITTTCLKCGHIHRKPLG